MIKTAASTKLSRAEPIGKKFCSSTFRSLCHYGHDFIPFWSYILQCKNSKGFENEMFIYSRPVVMVIYLFRLSQQREAVNSTLLAMSLLLGIEEANSDFSYIDIN
jgi:hypothetical protein